MLEIDDREYYLSREASARRMAAVASDPRIAAIHHDMASKYALRAGSVSQRLIAPIDQPMAR